MAALLLAVPSPQCAALSRPAPLERAAAIVDEDPVGALSVLDSLPLSSIGGRRNKAAYCLALSRATDAAYGFIPASDLPSVKYAAEYYSTRKPLSSRLEAFILYGKALYDAGEYSLSSVSYLRAEKVARKLHDDRALGDIYTALSHICNASGTPSLEAPWLEKATLSYLSAGDTLRALRAKLQYGHALRNSNDFEGAETVYKAVLGEALSAADTLTAAACLSAFAALKLEYEPDPAFVIEAIGWMNTGLKTPLSSIDKGNLAYAWSLEGDRARSERWLEESRKSAETADEKARAEFRTYQIASRGGDTGKALSSLEKVMDYTSGERLGSARTSAAEAQVAYLKNQEELEGQKLIAARSRLLALALLLLGILGTLVWYFKAKRLQMEKRLSDEKAENDRLMEVADDLRKALSAVKNTKNSPSGLNALERICEQYYIYEGTENLYPKIQREVDSIVSGLRSDPREQKKLERQLDSLNDGLMTRLREVFPKWKEEDFLLYSFAASGFSNTTMSLLLGKDKPWVYNRIYRLKGRISSSDVQDREFFLSFLR